MKMKTVFLIAVLMLGLSVAGLAHNNRQVVIYTKKGPAKITFLSPKQNTKEYKNTARYGTPDRYTPPKIKNTFIRK